MRRAGANTEAMLLLCFVTCDALAVAELPPSRSLPIPLASCWRQRKNMLNKTLNLISFVDHLMNVVYMGTSGQCHFPVACAQRRMSTVSKRVSHSGRYSSFTPRLRNSCMIKHNAMKPKTLKDFYTAFGTITNQLQPHAFGFRGYGATMQRDLQHARAFTLVTHYGGRGRRASLEMRALIETHDSTNRAVQEEN